MYVQVTVLPLETGRLYFAGLSYTLNRVHCCQILARQNARLWQLLEKHGLRSSASFAQSGESSSEPQVLTLRSSSLEDEERLLAVAREVME